MLMYVQESTTLLNVKNAPAIEGLIFRGFRGPEDYPVMLDVIDGSKHADGEERSDTLEDLIENYSHLTNCDPATDMIFAEVNGEPVGYGRVTWWVEEATGHYIHLTGIAFLLPEWRRKGIGGAMLGWLEGRLREHASRHPEDATKVFENWANDVQEDKHALLQKVGYEPCTYGAQMVLPDLSVIPEIPALPDGFEVRPVSEDQFRAIWEADREAFRDHWGFYEPTEEGYQRFLNDPLTMQPELWQIAWYGDQVAAQVRTFINTTENEEYGRKRGWTEFISTRRPFRRKGLARLLIIRSLHQLRGLGMNEAALGVHTENPNGAFQLYESIGYWVIRTTTIYRKTM
jgi:GNAT superfamily N-acetyltransferase